MRLRPPHPSRLRAPRGSRAARLQPKVPPGWPKNLVSSLHTATLDLSGSVPAPRPRHPPPPAAARARHCAPLTHPPQR
jgi:hypothetical protein